MKVNRVFLVLLTLSLFIFNSAFPQGGTWTWISGDSALNSLGVFGTQGVPSVNNHPPAFYETAEWKDKQGNFWIYGGVHAFGIDSDYSDLWKYNPFTNEWTWVKGNGLPAQPSVYGTQGVPNPLNSPGERGYAATTWVDSSGALWLFGGQALDNNQPNYKNDLWRYDIGTNQWTWMKGDSVTNVSGVHGTQGVPSPSNTPGARYETCSAWTDSLNNLWLFGGLGYDDGGNDAYLNDLCKFDISTNEWTWIKGSAYGNALANYGDKGVANSSNDPGARLTYNKWKDIQGNFWLMGGLAEDTISMINYTSNDLWKYDLGMNEWTWISGTNAQNDEGDYQSNCVFNTIDLPSSRMEQRSSVTDNCNKFWLFGGLSSGGGTFNDLWIFDPQQLKWNWISGANVPFQVGNYGRLGAPSPSNIPPSRFGAVAWWANDNKFYMFGGVQDNLGA